MADKPVSPAEAKRLTDKAPASGEVINPVTDAEARRIVAGGKSDAAKALDDIRNRPAKGTK